MALALLHTSPVHVPVFEGLRDTDHPGLGLRHLVYEDLLTRARESAAATFGVPVLRVDRPTAAAAAERERVLVLVTDSATWDRPSRCSPKRWGTGP